MRPESHEPPHRHTVSVVICMFTAERMPQIAAAIESVRRQTLRPREVVLVVDGTDSLAEEVRAALGALGEGLTFVCLGANLGVGVARTRGVEAATGDLVAFLDDDAEADPTWLEELAAPTADPRVIGVSGRSLPLFDGRRPGWLPDEFLWTVGCSYRGMPTSITEVRNFFGGCALVRRETFLAVGGFTAPGHLATFTGGGEEADFCLRATAHTGGVFVFNPAAVIHHHVPSGRLTWRYFAKRCYSEGVMKALMAARLDRTSLNPERAFARAMPRAVVRALFTDGERGRAAGILVGVLAVLTGLAKGRLDRNPSEAAA